MRILVCAFGIVVCHTHLVQSQSIKDSASFVATVQSKTSPSQCLAVIQEWDKTTQEGYLRGDVLDTANHRIANSRRSLGAKMASRCAGAYDAGQVKGAEGHALLDLYILSDKIDHARAQAVSMLGSAVLAEKANLLHMLVTRLMPSNVPLPAALAAPYEKFTEELDALGPGFKALQLAAHRSFEAAYQWDYSNPALATHVRRAYEIVQGMSTSECAAVRGICSTVYSLAAQLSADSGNFGAANQILTRAIETLPATGTANLVKELSRYNLVGKPAPMLIGQYWFNASRGMNRLDFKGKLTILEFTTTWCASCKKGYKVLDGLKSKYGSVIQPVLVSLIEGRTAFTGKVTDMLQQTPLQEELDYDRNYWLNEHKITFPIVILDPEKGSDDNDGLSSLRRPAIFNSYLVFEYPVYFFIDKQGIIRHVQVGDRWDLKERFANIVNKLLQ